MSQHDFDIANQGFAAFRADLNNALKALGSLSSGTAEPATTYANQLWYETDTNTLHIRDEANAAWLDLMVINQTTGSPSFNSGNVGIGTASPASIVGGTDTNPVLSIGGSDTTLTTGDKAGSVSFITNDTSYTGTYADGVTAEIASVATTVSGAAYGLAFYTGTVTDSNRGERMRIDASGNMGIGTSSPGAMLELATGNAGLGILAATNRLRFTDNDPTLISGQSTGAIEWYTSDTDAPGVHAYIGTLGANTGAADLTFGTGVGGSTSERMRITSAGNVGVGVTPSAWATVVPAIQIGGGGSFIAAQGSGSGNSDSIYIGTNAHFDGTDWKYKETNHASYFLQANGVHQWFTAPSGTAGNTITFTERARIDSTGVFSVGCTDLSSTSTTDTGAQMGSSGAGNFFRASNTPLIVMRQTNDGTLVDLRQGGASEGSISVSGTTVSYNGGHLSRWAQFPDNSRPELLKGTVMSNLDQMSQWGEEDNEQLNCVQVSTVEGDANVAGVFVAWDSTEDDYNDILLAMTGDMVIRIGAGVTVARGDLLMSAGDGTAKPQGDDIVRSKTIAKVTSTHVSHTYADGSYAVPCVLMAC